MSREAELREFWAARGVQLEEKRASVITAIQHSVENLGGFREVSVNGAWSQVAEAIAWDGMWSDVRRAYLRWVYPFDMAAAAPEETDHRDIDLGLRPRKAFKSASSSACPICNAVAILSGGALECSQCHSLFHSKCDGPSAQELSLVEDLPWMCTMCVACVGAVSCTICRQEHTSVYNPLLSCEGCLQCCHYQCRPGRRDPIARTSIEQFIMTPWTCTPCVDRIAKQRALRANMPAPELIAMMKMRLKGQKNTPVSVAKAALKKILEEIETGPQTLL